MVINKRIVGQMVKAYAPAIMNINGALQYLVASEGNGPCKMFDADSLAEKTIWDGPGGTMNIVPVPGRNNEFIATQKFSQSAEGKVARLVHAKCDSNSEWTVTPIMTVPFLHRFDLMLLDNKITFFGSTLSADKEHKEDWSKPGSVYVAELSEDLGKPFELQPILQGITKNHGFCQGRWNGREAYLVSGEEGVFVVYVPEKAGGKWATEQILSHEVSDIAVCDIDNDGVMELASIEPFHGSRGLIYKLTDGKLAPIHEHEYEFGHVVWGGKILNKPSFIIGGRKGNRELNCFQMDAASGKIGHFTIDNTSGPSNIAVLNKKNSDVILAANREIEEIAVYEITA